MIERGGERGRDGFKNRGREREKRRERERERGMKVNEGEETDRLYTEI